MLKISARTRKVIWYLVLVVLIVILVVLVYQYPFFTKTIPPKRSEWAYEDVQVTELNDLGMYGAGVTVGLIDQDY